MTDKLLIVGWRELIDLPDLKIRGIKAKIDTGARSSALHAYHIEEFKSNGKTMVKFFVHPYQRDTKQTAIAEAKLLEYRQVRSSGGHIQLRPVVETIVKLGHKQWSIELTLTNRDVMGFRMLLGRQAVRHKFLIDPGKSFLQSKEMKD
ncbi:MAG: ATP-dependent zinc protease family protein [Xenococcaceae cyanobacterium]